MTEYEFLRYQLQYGGGEQGHNKAWDLAAPHRAMVTRILIDKGGERTGKLALLGAGPCNDISLAALKEWYEEVHLFDMNGTAVWEGVDKQGFTGAEWIHVHGNIDVTGAGEPLAGVTRSADPERSLSEIMTTLPEFRLEPFSGQFDVVASTCLLSQIIEHAVGSIGEDHPQFVELITNLRRQHFLMMIDLCKPSGQGILIYDFVSSVSLPGIIGTSGEDLKVLLNRALENHNFFHGMNPLVISDVLTQDPVISPLITNLRAAHPWVWDAVTRHYAVTAIRFQRRSPDAP